LEKFVSFNKHIVAYIKSTKRETYKVAHFKFGMQIDFGKHSTKENTFRMMYNNVFV